MKVYLKTFRPEELARLYKPLSMDSIVKARLIANNIYTNLSKLSPSSSKKEIREVTKVNLTGLEFMRETIHIGDVFKKVQEQDKEDITLAKKQLEKGTFGYSASDVYRGDIRNYLKGLETSASKHNIQLVREGVDIAKIEVIQYPMVEKLKDKLVILHTDQLADSNTFAKNIEKIKKLADIT